MPRFRVPPLLILLLLIGLAVFVTGIRWGLPSHAADPFLFGDHPRWSGRKIMNLAGGWNPASSLGADVETNPTLPSATTLTPLNTTDAERARIIRRYRLYSYQPDEWLTLRALSQIKAHHGDPRVYQYGGLWVYPIGLFLKLASYTGYIILHPDPAFYIDHPSLFGRFYVIARAYSVFWGLAGIVAIWTLLRLLGVRSGMAFAGGLCFLLMPVVVNSAHEAKPHLGGLALLLWMIAAAVMYTRTGHKRWWWGAAILAGAAAAMVLSSVLGWVALLVMLAVRPASWKNRLGGMAAALAVALLVYLLLNPFVAINLIRNPAILRSNLGNSSAMYPLTHVFAGLWNTISLIGEGTGRVLAVIGLVGAAALALVYAKRGTQRGAYLLIAVPALLVAVVMAAVGAGKPAEFGRFALLTDAALLLGAFVAADRFLKSRFERIIGPLLLIIATGFFGLIYLRGFWRDSSTHPSRLIQAATLQKLLSQGCTTLAMPREPAPYCLPPVNVFQWHLYLLPSSGAIRSDEIRPDVIARPVDRPVHTFGLGTLLYEQVRDPAPHEPFASPISWADKPMEILRLRKQPSTSFASAANN